MLLGLLHRLGPHRFLFVRLLIPLLLVGALVAVVILFIERSRPARARRGDTPWPPRGWQPSAPGEDPALFELRMRYARGEIGLEEYNERVATLTRSRGGGDGPAGGFPPGTR